MTEKQNIQTLTEFFRQVLYVFLYYEYELRIEVKYLLQKYYLLDISATKVNSLLLYTIGTIACFEGQILKMCYFTVDRQRTH